MSKTLAGIITSWNRAAERIFGYSESEAVGQHITMLFPPDRIPEEKHFLTEIAAGRRVDTSRPSACGRTASGSPCR